MTEHNTSGGLTEGEREALAGLAQWHVVGDVDLLAQTVERILVDHLAAVEAEHAAEVSEQDREHEKTLAIMEAACDRADSERLKVDALLIERNHALDEATKWQSRALSNAEQCDRNWAEACRATARAESAEAENARLRAEVEQWEESSGNWQTLYQRERARLGAVEALAEEATERAYFEIAVEKCLTVMRVGDSRAAVPGHWREEAEGRATITVADLRAALDSPTSHAQQEAEVGARVLREAADAFDSLSRTYDAMSRHWFAGRLRARADALAADTTGEPS